MESKELTNMTTSTNTKPETCADKIADKLANRNAEILAIMNDPDSDDSYDIALSIDSKQVTTVCLSYGGPADYIEIIHNGYDIHGVTYRYSDWFDTAVVQVEKDEPLYTYARDYIIETMSHEG